MQEPVDNLDPLRSRPSLLPAPASDTVVETAPAAGFQLDILRLVRDYAVLGAFLTILGAACGFIAVALIPPRYTAKARVEVQPMNSGVLKLSTLDNDVGQVDLQTEAEIVTSNAFLRKVIAHVQLGDASPAPLQSDIFAKLRRYLHVNTDDDATIPINVEAIDLNRAPRKLAMALKTVQANQVGRTRILEISCDSTNPEFAANFLNSLTDEYIQQNLLARTETVRLTTQWLSQQLEDTRKKMLDSDERLRQFVQNSGNLFVSQDSTLADVQVRDLRDRIAAVQSDLIGKQTRYEMMQKASGESLPSLLNDETVAAIESKIAELKQKRTLLLTTLTPENPRVKQIDVQLSDLQVTLNKQVDNAKRRISNDYEEARRNVEQLRKAYAARTEQVATQSGKQAQYEALKREAETARTTYNTTLLQANQASVVGSLPVNNIRVVDPAVPPLAPYKPMPPLIISIGAAAGLAICAGIGVLRQMLDQRVSSPIEARQLLNLPQLGVIPSLNGNTKQQRWTLPSLGKGAQTELSITNALPTSTGLSTLDPSSATREPLLAESFRSTLASLMRESASSRPPQVILVTSVGPAEGKTTIACNLGIALAESGRRVLVVDSDFRRPRVHSVFGLPNSRGLADILQGSSALNEIAREDLGERTALSRLWILPNGCRSENIARVLYSERLRELIARVRREFDTVLIDAPPILHLADARIMSDMVDGVILVLRIGVTDRRSATEALDQLRRDKTPILGTVLNDWKPSKSELRRRYYYSTYGSSDRI